MVCLGVALYGGFLPEHRCGSAAGRARWPGWWTWAIGPGNTVYVVEVKASRSDFARDNHTKGDLAALMAQRREYIARTGLAKDTLVQTAAFAKKERPDAWREVEAYRQALAGYRRMLWKERAHKDRVASFSIKFHDDRFMGIADYHYIIAPRDVVNQRSFPPLWGLLNDTPRAVVEAPKKNRYGKARG